MTDIAIRVQNLSKCYQIYGTPRDRLKQFVIPKLCRAIPALRKLFPTPHFLLTTPQGQPTPHPLLPTDQGVLTSHSQLTIYHSPVFYKEFWALKDVSFEIKKGETVGIIGRNGSGKSTLLQLICGTLSPTSGTVETNGRIAALLELGSGFNPEFTGRENVYLNGALLGLSKEEVDERFEAIAAFADIGDFIEQPVKTYSSGMFVRLAFAIQANVDPEILIVDEALAVGDVFFVHRCMSRFHELKNIGTTILLVSHDPTAIKTLCDRAIWLKNGLMGKIGNAGEVVDSYLADDYEFRPGVSVSSYTKNENISDGQKLPSYPSLVPTTRQGNHLLVVEGGAILDSGKSQVDQLFPSRPISLVLRLKNHLLSPGAALVIGYALRNIRGVDIASNSNEVEGIEIAAPEQGGVLIVEAAFVLPHLHPGQYAFSISVGSRDKLGLMQGLDLLENAMRFEMLEVKKCHVLMTFETVYNCIYEQ